MTSDRRGAVVAGGAVGLVGLWFGGGGFLNGDAAAYAAQGWAGDVGARPVHALWCAVAVALAPWAEAALPRALDAANALAAAGLVATSGARGGGLLVVAAFVLPWCAFAEVDLMWMALVMSAVRVAPSWASACLSGLAVATSPTALLALPWVARRRRGWGPLLGGGLAVVGLTLWSSGGWWVGHRGVLLGEWLPGRTLGAWASTGLWIVLPVAAVRGDRSLAWVAPLLLAPPDVPAWVFVGVVAAVRWPTAEGWPRALALGAVGVGAVALLQRWERVASEDTTIRAVAAAHRPGLGYEGPWSWGSRLSVVTTGATDRLPFRPLRPLHDGRWPAPKVEEVGLLPPGRAPEMERELLRVDERGVHWVAPWWLPDG